MKRLAAIVCCGWALAAPGLALADGESAPQQFFTPPIPTTVPADLAGAGLYKAVCAACHGPEGQGNEQLKAPSIAHLPAYYVRNQMESFRADRRGVLPGDTQGMIMAAIAKALTPEQVESMAEHVEAMEMVTPEVRVVEGADLREGQWLFEMRCMECHRFNGSGELAFGSPPLVGLQGWYLADQLSKFKTGLRGAVKGDENGAKMVFTSSFIENEQMLKDIVGYILTLNPPPASDPFSSR